MSFAVKLMSVMVLSGVALAASAADAPASPVDAAQAAVLKCHADYVQQVTAKHRDIGLDAMPAGFTASEIAHASTAACKPALDAYAQKVSDSSGGNDDYAKGKADALSEYAFDYTLDALIKLASSR